MNVLAIGAGAEQIFSIKEARKKGFFVVAIDGNCDAEGFKYANIAYTIDLENTEKIIRIAIEHDVKFILPAPIGRFLTTIGAVNDALKLPGVTKQSAEILTNKKLYFYMLKTKNLFSPKQVYIDSVDRSIESLEKEIAAIGFPCILKTNNGSGSRGVVAIHSFKEINRAVQFHLNSVLETEGTLIESFITGKEYGIDGRVVKGKFELLLIREKILTKLPHRQEVGYIAPIKVSEKVRKQIISDLQSIVSYLNIDNCLMHADIIVGVDSVFLVEVSARPAGLGLMESFIPSIIGFNPITDLMDIFVGKDKGHSIIFNEGEYYGIYFFDLPLGEIKSLPNKNTVTSSKDILTYNCRLIQGDKIEQVKEGKDIFPRGSFIAKNSRILGLEKIKNDIYSKFIIH